MTYAQFRSGLCYQEVWRMLWVADPDPAKWVRKSRGKVLSLWRSIKRDLWEELLLRGIDPETLPAPPRVHRIAAPFRGLVDTMLVADPNVSVRTIFERARRDGYCGSYGTLSLLVATSRRQPKSSLTRPFRSLVETTLATDPSTETRAMLRLAREQGYRGSESTFYQMVQKLRPPRRRRPPQRARVVVAPARQTAAGRPLKPAPSLVSARAAARMLGISEERVLLDIGRGRFPGALRGRGGWRSWLIPLSDIAGPDPAPSARAA